MLWPHKERFLRSHDDDGGGGSTDESDVRKAQFDAFFKLLTPSQKTAYIKITETAKVLHQVTSVRSSDPTYTSSFKLVDMLQHSWARADTFFTGIKPDPGNYPFEALSSLPAWLTRPHVFFTDLAPLLPASTSTAPQKFYRSVFPNYSDTRPITLYDVFTSIYNRAFGNKAHKVALLSDDILTLDEAEYTLMAAMLQRQLVLDAEDNTHQLLTDTMLIFTGAVPGGVVEDEFNRRQPLIIDKGLTPTERKKRKKRYQQMHQILQTFIYDTIQAIADDDLPNHEAAVQFLKAAEQTLNGGKILKYFLPQGYDRSWLIGVKTLEEESADPWFGKLYELTLEALSHTESPWVLRSQDLNDIFTPLTHEDMDRLPAELENAAQSMPFVLTEIEPADLVTLSYIFTPTYAIQSLRVLSFPTDAHIRVTVKISDISTRKRKQFIVSHHLDAPLADMFFSVIDSEVVSDTIRIAVARFLANILRHIPQDVNAATPNPPPIIEPTPLSLSFKIPDRGLAKTPRSEDKRPKKPHLSTPSARFESRIYEPLHRPRLVLPDTKAEEIASSFSPHVADLVTKAFVQYRNGGGIIKIMTYVETRNGSRILTLRAGRNYRILFEMSEEGCTFIDVIHRRDLPKYLKKFE